MNGWVIMLIEANNVGYWGGRGQVSGADEAAQYDTRDDAENALAFLRGTERWSWLVRGRTAVVVLA